MFGVILHALERWRGADALAQTGFLPVVTMVRSSFALKDEKREEVEVAVGGIRRWRERGVKTQRGRECSK